MLVNNSSRFRIGIVGQRLQVSLFSIIGSHHTPGTRPPAILTRIYRVSVVGRVTNALDVRTQRHSEGELLGDTGILRISPTRVRRGTITGTTLQPFHAMNRRVMLVLVSTRLDFDFHQIGRIGSYQRCERVTRLDTSR